jgi:hypothetical protein
VLLAEPRSGIFIGLHHHNDNPGQLELVYMAG